MRLLEHTRAVRGPRRPPSSSQASSTSARRDAGERHGDASLDTQALAGHQATLAAARAKEQVDCAGEGAAEAASANSSPSSETTRRVVAELALERRAGRLCRSRTRNKHRRERSALTARLGLLGPNSSRTRSPTCPWRAHQPRSTARAPPLRRCPQSARSSDSGRACIDLRPAGAAATDRVQPTRALTLGMSAGPCRWTNANLDALGYGKGSRATITAASGGTRALQSRTG